MPAPTLTTGLAVEELLAEAPSGPARIDGVVVATLVGFDDGGAPRIAFAGNPYRRPVSARSTVALTAADAGAEVAASFEQGDPARPIVLGKLWQPSTPAARAGVDGDRLVFSAKHEVVLECGEASITLTRAGKILLRGTYVLSRSSGVNRIKGGAVQIN